MFEKVLVCLDGSELAEQILPYVTEEALRFRSKVVLVRVATIPIIVPIPGAGMEAAAPAYQETASFTTELVVEQQIERGEKEARVYLERMGRTLEEKGLDVEWVVQQGTPGEAIVKYAGENMVTLIAITTHGRSGLGRVIFGSVADFVVRESGLPVLLVRPQEAEG